MKTLFRKGGKAKFMQRTKYKDLKVENRFFKDS